MTTNPFRHICGECKSPWRDGDSVCWNCGSKHAIDNPAYGESLAPAQTSLYRSPISKPDPVSPISNTPYVITSLVIAVIFGMAALSETSIVAAALIGVFAGAIAWTIAQVTITRKRTEHIEAMVAQLTTRQHS